MTVEQDLQSAITALNGTNQAVQSNLNTLTSATASAAANAATTTADRAAVAADKATVAADKATVAADKATVAADKATVAGYKSDVSADRFAVAGLLNTFRSVMLGKFSNDESAVNFANANSISIVDGVMYQNTVSDKFRIYNGEAWQDYDSSAAAVTSAAGVSAASAAVDAGAAQSYKNDALSAKTAAEAARDTATGAATTATNQANTATTKAIEAAADRVQTGLDRTQTGQDRVQTGQDRVQTGLDRTQTGQDRVQTGQDRSAAAASATAAAASATEVSGGLSSTLQNVSSIATLSTIPVSTTRGINLTGYYTAGDGGGGKFYGVLTASPPADNAGTIIRASGGYWKREDDGPVNVKWFGAVGDNVTDDRVAINRAITFATAQNKSVMFPAGTYYTGTTTLSVTCPIYGNSATVRGWLTLIGDDITIRDLKIISTNPTMAVYLFGSVTAPTYYYRQKLINVSIDFDTGVARTVAQGQAASPQVDASFGVYASNIVNLTISNCYIRHAIQLIGCADYTISNNVIDGVNYFDGNELIHASFRSHGVISGNHFKNANSNFIDLYSSGERTVVTNNRFDGNKLVGTAIELKVTLTDTTNSSNDTNGWEEQIVFTDNIIYNCQLSSSNNSNILNIYYQDNRAVKTFNWSNTPRNVIVSGNIFDTLVVGSYAGALVNVIELANVNSVLIDNNIFRNIAGDATVNDASSCVWLEGGRDIIISNNKLNLKDGCGINMIGDCANLSIVNNHMTNDLKFNYALKYGIRIQQYGTRATPVIKNCKITGNTVDCSLWSISQVLVAGCAFEDVIISNNIFLEQSRIFFMKRGLITGNIFKTTSQTNQGLQIGNLSAGSGNLCSHTTIVGNHFVSIGTPRPGLVLWRLRASNINQNMFYNVSTALSMLGLNTSGEFDYLNIKDNFVNQTAGTFPTPTTTGGNAVTSSDLQTWRTANNQMVTA